MPATTKKNKARIIPCVAGFVSPVFGKEVGAGIFCPGVGDGTEDEPGVGVEVGVFVGVGEFVGVEVGKGQLFCPPFVFPTQFIHDPPPSTLLPIETSSIVPAYV